MQITPSTLERAMYQIIREQALTAHTWISHHQLQLHWTASGLRQTDLRDALRLLAESGVVDLVNAGDGLMVSVTDRGYALANARQSTLRHWLRDTQDAQRLRQAQERQHDAAARLQRGFVPQGPDRRSSGQQQRAH